MGNTMPLSPEDKLSSGTKLDNGVNILQGGKQNSMCRVFCPLGGFKHQHHKLKESTSLSAETTCI